MASNDDRPMTLDAFQELLDRRGAALDAWPADDRAAALRLVRESGMAAEALARAERLAMLMGQASQMAASPELKARVLAAAARRAERGAAVVLRALWPFGPLWRPAAGLAAAALLGIAIGSANLESTRLGAVLDGADEQLTSGLSGEVLVIASNMITVEETPSDF